MEEKITYAETFEELINQEYRTNRASVGMVMGTILGLTVMVGSVINYRKPVSPQELEYVRVKQSISKLEQGREIIMPSHNTYNNNEKIQEQGERSNQRKEKIIKLLDETIEKEKSDLREIRKRPGIEQYLSSRQASDQRITYGFGIGLGIVIGSIGIASIYRTRKTTSKK